MDDRPPVARPSPPAPCFVIEAKTVSFALYPPVDFTIDDRAERYRLLLPFGTATMDISIGGGPCLRRRLRPGDLVLAQPGVGLVARHVQPVELLLVTVNSERARAAARDAVGEGWMLGDLPQRFDTAAAVLGQEMRRALIGEAIPSPGYLSALADALVARTAAVLATEVRRAAREPIAPTVLARVVRHVETALAGPIDVAALARVAGLSEAHFARAFAKATGDPPHRFVMRRRVCRARELLSSTDVPISAVAARSGFASQQHMSTAFRREVGLSPAKYREAFGASEDREPMLSRGAN